MRSVAFLLVGSMLVTACNGCSGVSTIASVDAATGAVEMRLSFSNVALGVGQSAQLAATLLDRAGVTVPGTISWRSSNAAVATVDRTGRIAGMAPGSAVVFASYDTITAQAAVVVNEIVRTVASVSITAPPT
jgi:hypothetical protein